MRHSVCLKWSEEEHQQWVLSPGESFWTIVLRPVIFLVEWSNDLLKGKFIYTILGMYMTYRNETTGFCQNRDSLNNETNDQVVSDQSRLSVTMCFLLCTYLQINLHWNTLKWKLSNVYGHQERSIAASGQVNESLVYVSIRVVNINVRTSRSHLHLHNVIDPNQYRWR